MEKLARMIPAALHQDVTNSKKKNVIPNHANLNAFGLNGENGVLVLPIVPKVRRIKIISDH